MKLTNYIFCLMLPSIVAASENTTITFDFLDIILPGDCSYLTNSERFKCTTESNLVYVSFPSREELEFEASQEKESLKTEVTSIKGTRNLKEFRSTYSNGGDTIYQFSVCNYKDCITVLGGRIVNSVFTKIKTQIIATE